MGSGGKSRWKISSFYHRSLSSSSPTKTPPPPVPTKEEPPKEFVCPISGRLMADPVILPSGQTFERNYIQACKDLGFSPSVLPNPSPLPPPDHPLLLIPNLALKSAILNWCHSQGLEPPQPISPTTALHLVRTLQPTPTHKPERAGKEKEENGDKEDLFDTTTTPPPLPPTKPSSCYSTPSYSSPSSSSPSYSTSFSSSEIVVVADETLTPNPHRQSPSTTTSTSPMEEEILAKLKCSNVSDQEEALVRIRTATRDGGKDYRASLCTPKLLAALRPFLLSRYPSLQANAAASLVNLSLEPPNRIPIVRSGAVPPLVDAVKAGHPEARGHAAAALFSLAIEDANKAAIGVLGALPPLLHVFSRTFADERARHDAAMALYHLSTAGTNRSKLLRLGAARALLGVAATAGNGDGSSSSPSMVGVAVMILCNLAACGEGRTALMDAGAVERLVGLIRECGNSEADGPRREHCVATLYGMSRGSMRFRGLARAAGAEEILGNVAAEEGLEEEKGGRRCRTREMARRTLRAMRGEEELQRRGGDEDETKSCVSDPAVSFRRRHERQGHVSGANSSEF